MIKNIFFDRDGIINEVVRRDGIISSPRNINEFSLRKEFQQVYNKLKERNLNLFVISNQPDIARKLLTEEVLQEMTDEIKSRFLFKEILYCRHDNSDNCNCRKPKPGLIIDLIKKYNLKKEECILIGDSCKDIQAGKNAGIKTMLLITDYNIETDCEPDYKLSKLEELLNLI